MRLLRLDIEYDGGAFSGWQRQKTSPRTVQQILEEALWRILQEKIVVTGASRTDAGVHARGQVAHFSTASTIPPGRLRWSVNALLPPEILVRRVRVAPRSFHARFGATRKRYRYRVWNAPDRPLWDRAHAWHERRPLDLARMREAARALAGRRDFKAFTTADRKRKSRNFVRTLHLLRLSRSGVEIRVDLAADGFLYNMARVIVGTLVEVGLGKRPPQSVPEALKRRDRRLAGRTAPAHGLCLMRVEYGPPVS